VVNPTVLALPDDTASSSVIPTSLLTASKGIKSRHCPALSPSPAATALSRSPGTPALLPTHLAEDDDEGWEHIPSSPHHSAEGDRDEEMSEDEDVIVLGELELEDELEELDLSREVKGEKERRGTKGLSYAAALEGKA